MSASCEQVITLAGDLHARPAGALAVAAGRFASAVSVTAADAGRAAGPVRAATPPASTAPASTWRRLRVCSDMTPPVPAIDPAHYRTAGCHPISARSPAGSDTIRRRYRVRITLRPRSSVSVRCNVGSDTPTSEASSGWLRGTSMRTPSPHG